MAGKQMIDPSRGYEKQFGYSQAEWADVRGSLQALLPRLPADAVVDPQVRAYVERGQYPKDPSGIA